MGCGTHAELMGAVNRIAKSRFRSYRKKSWRKVMRNEPAGGNGKAEGGIAAPPRRAWPHGSYDARRKGTRLQRAPLANSCASWGNSKVAFIAAIVFAMASAAFNIVGPKVLSQATTELFDGIVAKIGGTGGIDFDAVGAILLATLALYCVSAACSFVQGWMMTSVSQRTCYGLRRQIAEKIDRLPVGYFERTSTGDVLSRASPTMSIRWGKA